jgi:hypothetical protein
MEVGAKTWLELEVSLTPPCDAPRIGAFRGFNGFNQHADGVRAIFASMLGKEVEVVWAGGVAGLVSFLLGDYHATFNCAGALRQPGAPVAPPLQAPVTSAPEAGRASGVIARVRAMVDGACIWEWPGDAATVLRAVRVRARAAEVGRV